MNKSESITNLSAALVKAQASIGGAVKDTKNPFFKSSYANLGEVMHACKSALLEQGIIVSQFVSTGSTGPALETMLLHSSGEWIGSAMPVVCAKPNDPQALGSAITYARRYALQSALFIPAVDDDAEAAMFRESSKVQPARVDRPIDGEPQDFRHAKVHFGRHAGSELHELNPQQIAWLENDWKPKKLDAADISVEDRALLDALNAYADWRKAERK